MSGQTAMSAPNLARAWFENARGWRDRAHGPNRFAEVGDLERRYMELVATRMEQVETTTEIVSESLEAELIGGGLEPDQEIRALAVQALATAGLLFDDCRLAVGRLAEVAGWIEGDVVA
jgi:hypothetical protein